LVAAGQIGEARIGIGPAMRWFLPPFAEAVAKRWPSLRLNLNVDMRERLLTDLKAGALDLVITARTLEFGSDYVHSEILREPVVAVASADHPLARLDHITIADFLRYPNAGASEPSILTAPGAHGAAPGVEQESLVVCNDDTTLKHLASRGLVTLLCNQQLVQAELESGELVRLPLAWQLTISFVAVMTRATSHSPIFREIVDLAQGVAKKANSF
jgi:DNA-binding transcriptional LysR family regulator